MTASQSGSARQGRPDVFTFFSTPPGSLAFRVRSVGREGIEPPQPKAADLQSAEHTTLLNLPACRFATNVILPAPGPLHQPWNWIRFPGGRTSGRRSGAAEATGRSQLAEPWRRERDEVAHPGEERVRYRARLGLHRHDADRGLAVADRELGRMDGRVAGTDAHRTVRAHPAIHVCRRALGSVVERVATEERTELVVRGDTVAVRD